MYASLPFGSDKRTRHLHARGSEPGVLLSELSANSRPMGKPGTTARTTYTHTFLCDDPPYLLVGSWDALPHNWTQGRGRLLLVGVGQRLTRRTVPWERRLLSGDDAESIRWSPAANVCCFPNVATPHRSPHQTRGLAVAKRPAYVICPDSQLNVVVFVT